MPDYAFVIALAVFVVVAVVAFKLLQGALKIAVILAALAAITAGLMGFLVVMDANDLKENFQKDSLFLLSDNSTVISGLEIQGQSEPKIVGQQQLADYTSYIKVRDYESARGSHYKLVVISTAAMPQADAEKARKAGYLEERALILVGARNAIFSDPLLLVDEYKKGNILVYEETAVFKAIKIIPTPVMRFVAKKFITAAKQGVESLED